MAWIDGKLSWLKDYVMGPQYKRELDDLYLAADHTSKRLKYVEAELATSKQYNKELLDDLKELQKVNKLHSINDAEYWLGLFKKTKVVYPKKASHLYLVQYDLQWIDNLAEDLIEEYSLTAENPDNVIKAWMDFCVREVETQTRRIESSTKRFKYVPDKNKKEEWVDLIEFEKRHFQGDCEEIAKTMYFVIRRIFQILGVWEKVSHRLFCQDCLVFRGSPISNYEGRHSNGVWRAEDCQLYTVETTYQANKAKANFLKKPQNMNKDYKLNYLYDDKVEYLV